MDLSQKREKTRELIKFNQFEMWMPFWDEQLNEMRNVHRLHDSIIANAIVITLN